MTATSVNTAEVAIVGGGPVGMMLALFLDRHGVKTVLFNIEQDTRWHPKGSTHNSRTMEHYRRLGISRSIRALGLPPEHQTDVSYFTRYNSHELARIHMPSEREKIRSVVAAPRTHQNFEPIHRANQMYVEQFLSGHVRTRKNIQLRYGWQVDQFTESDDGVVLQAHRVQQKNADNVDYFDHAVQAAQASERGPAGASRSERETWRVQYMVGCDGGQSHVRRTLGIPYQGHDNLKQAFLGGRTISSHLRVPDLITRCFSGRESWQYWVVNPELRTALVALNGKDEFLYWTRLPDGQEFNQQDILRSFQQACGLPLQVEVLGNRNWTAGVALWAEQFGSGKRIFLAGDAIHLFTPTGGFGMNTGIDGAANLAWKLAASVQGWAGTHLLASYQTERQPVARRNTTAAQQLARNVGSVPVPDCIEQNTAAGEDARRSAGAYLSTFGEEFGSIGVQLGVRYDGSPLIAEDGAPPPDSYVSYTPSAVPGGRAPHCFFDPPGLLHRRSLFDLFGIGFTLLRLHSASDSGAALQSAAIAMRIPLAVVDVEDDEARQLYGRDLALIRPDQHVCWRGNRLPGDCLALMRQVTGH